MGPRSRTWLAILLTGAIGASAAAHDFWVAPSKYRVAPEARVSVRLLVGEMFDGEGYARNPRHVERFVLRGPDVRTSSFSAGGLVGAATRCYRLFPALPRP